MTFSSNALQEILANIKEGDLIKARLVLEHFNHLNTSDQRRILFEINKAGDEFGLPLLAQLLCQDDKTAGNYPTILETVINKAIANPDIVRQQINKKGDQQAYFISLTGDLQLQTLADDLTNILLTNDDNQILETALIALGKIGDGDAVNTVSEFLYVDQENLVEAATVTLGLIGNPTALQRLYERLGSDQETSIRILNIFLEIQDETALSKLNDTLLSRTTSLRNYARTCLVKLGAKVVPLIAANLSGQDHDLQIQSLNILKEISDSTASPAIRKLLNGNPANANVRFAAYEALGKLSSQKGDYVLASGLEDPDSNVRMAAVRAIDHNLNPLLVAGIKNILSQDKETSAEISKTIIDAKATRIFSTLLDEPSFTEPAFLYLAGDVHLDILDYFIQALLAVEKIELADSLIKQADSHNHNASGLTVWAVDDSKMILNVYRTVLNELDHESRLFSEPAEALMALGKERPDVLCTDLNMPEISGIELIQRARELHPKNKLPIIMVTTQNELTDNKAAMDAGVNEIINKPFSPEKLQGAIERVSAT